MSGKTESPLSAIEPTLADLIEKARKHVMTPEEIFEQKVSFIYGMQKLSVATGYTKDEIRNLLRAGDTPSQSAPKQCFHGPEHDYACEDCRPRSSTRASELAARLQVAVEKIWETTNQWPAALEGHAECMDIVHELHNFTPSAIAPNMDVIERAMTQFAMCISVLAGDDKTRAEVMVEESRPILRDAINTIRRADRRAGQSEKVGGEE